ncbi:MAG: hypothetical protein DWQ34_12895 [Planctomycetota bacterium]|nr:MAG: hypothetical protein DWQ34_12895 [Planctomycetota bacterium]REJ95700.1 MAG: hypothetical protein DWQ29_01665 [Planctomycetota bacterium]REK22926.1 MAG: hypothetical protein DWQ41_18125 [Planctomycetota bacterium]REK27786.1 MAG: hypothetical protein DWQ45_25320 [Planctomycetota bacterium]
MPTEDNRRTPFAGFYKPYTTPVPDNFFDEVLPDLSGAEVKVLLYIFRRTFGWKKESDNISLSQLVHGITKKDGTVLDRGTGLGKTSVARAMKQLVDKGMIRKTTRRSAESGHEPTTYEPVLSEGTPLSHNGTRGVPKVDKGLSQNGTYKKQLYKRTVHGGEETDEQTPDGGSDARPGHRPEAAEADGKSPLRQLPDLGLDAGHVELIAGDIVAQLGDEQSLAFYRLVARTVPEAVIREALSSIKTDGARDPRRLFTYRMQQYAIKKLYGVD